jgi:hypothetical protein
MMSRATHFVLASLCTMSCARSTPPPCAAPYAKNPALEARVTRLLASDPEAGPLLERAPDDLHLCFAPGGSGVVNGSTLYLDDRQSPERLGARTAHLLYHVTHGQTRTSGRPDDSAEAPANALEARVLRRLAATRY